MKKHLASATLLLVAFLASATVSFAQQSENHPQPQPTPNTATVNGTVVSEADKPHPGTGDNPQAGGFAGAGSSGSFTVQDPRHAAGGASTKSSATGSDFVDDHSAKSMSGAFTTSTTSGRGRELQLSNAGSAVQNNFAVKQDDKGFSEADNTTGGDFTIQTEGGRNAKDTGTVTANGTSKVFHDTTQNSSRGTVDTYGAAKVATTTAQQDDGDNKHHGDDHGCGYSQSCNNKPSDDHAKNYYGDGDHHPDPTKTTFSGNATGSGEVSSFSGLTGPGFFVGSGIMGNVAADAHGPNAQISFDMTGKTFSTVSPDGKTVQAGASLTGSAQAGSQSQQPSYHK